jgi:hypothetical protein
MTKSRYDVDNEGNYIFNSAKEYYQEVLKGKDIYVSGVKISINRNWDAGIWQLFNLYFINGDNKLERIWFGDEIDAPVSWTKTPKESSKWHFKTDVLGSNRYWEIVSGLSRFLYEDDYSFKEPEFLSN